jgi:prevent-host-death family protein
MSVAEAISQRDLRLRSKEIMDAVEGGQSFTVTRDGREIGRLVPQRRQRRFLTRAEFAASSRGAAAVDLERFRADLDRTVRGSVDDPYGR